jgi:hypothetical protein
VQRWQGGILLMACEHHGPMKGARNSTGGERQLVEAGNAETRRSAAATRRCVKESP